VPSLVSIILPAFRARATIARAVESLLRQSWEGWEAVIASDDGVDYLALLADAGLRDERLRQVSTGAVGSGDGPARTCALQAAQGDFVATLDADDAFAPDRLERLLPLARAGGAAVDNTQVIEEQGRPWKVPFPAATADFTMTAGDILGPRVPFFPVADRRFLPARWVAVPFCSDVLFNLELLSACPRMTCCAASLYAYHKTAGSLTNSAATAVRAEEGYRAILDLLERGELALTPPIRAAARAEFGENLRVNAIFARFVREGRVATLEQFLDLTDNGKAAWLKDEA